MTFLKLSVMSVLLSIGALATFQQPVASDQIEKLNARVASLESRVTQLEGKLATLEAAVQWSPKGPADLGSADVQARRLAAAHLARDGALSAWATPRLAHAATEDTDKYVRLYAVRALGEIGPEASSAVPSLIAALRDSYWAVRLASILAIAKLGPDAASASTAVSELWHDATSAVEGLEAERTLQAIRVFDGFRG